MCGIIGVAITTSGGFHAGDQTIAEELLFMDTVRGEDSTGVCLVKNDGSVTVAKKATWAPNFVCSKAFKDVHDATYKSGKMFLGHNRKATVGNVVSENAHPFVVNNELVLMHNGSLSGHKHLGDTEVDSEAIAQYIHDKWDDNAGGDSHAEVLAKLGGAWALVWYDLRSEKLHIVRNAQRPMSYLWDKGTLYWASDHDMLVCVLKRNSVYTAPKQLPPLTLLTFDGTKLEEVVLPSAPFFPPPTKYTPTTSVVTQTADGTEFDKLSKNAFKKFTRNFIGKTITFNVEDFVEVHGKLEWYGDNTSWQFDHEITGTLNNEALMMQVLDNYSLAEGKVVSATRNKTTGYVSFRVELLGAANAVETCH